MARAPDDSVLVEQARSGSQSAAEDLFKRHWSSVWKAAYAVTSRAALADDVAQDAFVRAFRSLDDFDAERPFGPWIKRIAVNRALDELRRERRLRLVEGDEAERAERALEPLVVDETIAAVRRLTPDKRLVVVLHFWLGYSLEQSAEMLELPAGTVASRLSRGLADLRAELEEGREDCA